MCIVDPSGLIINCKQRGCPILENIMLETFGPDYRQASGSGLECVSVTGYDENTSKASEGAHDEQPAAIPEVP